MTKQFHSPVKLSGAALDRFAGGKDPAAVHQIAQQTSWALLNRVRRAQDPRLVARVLEHAATCGVDDMAVAWQRAHPHSLAGVLWRLYLLRHAAQRAPQLKATLYRSGVQAMQSGETVVAGLTEQAGPQAVLRLCDEILRGIFSGDFAAALDRAWAYCRILAVGAAYLADERETYSAAEAGSLTRSALTYSQFAADIAAAARLWRTAKLD